MPKSSPKAAIAVIGGTGLDQIEGMTSLQTVDIDTPFGKPSDSITIGKLEGESIAFLPRHGRGHRISPTELPSRANIYALKSLGVQHIIAVCSAGSFQQEIAPGHLLIPDQLIDRTRNRISTFFTDGIVAHISFAHPFCRDLSKILYQSAKETGATVHQKGTYVTMEGPAFSTRAESRLYKSWGADIIGMTALPEAKLAREAEICYAVIGCVTDYDSWWEPVEPVKVETILKTMRENIDTARRIIKLAVKKVSKKRDCECALALAGAIVTDPAKIPAAQKKKLELLIGKYIK
ncbi:MAG: methylthioadenosine phosphorylase [Chloroflexi bacterium RBG_13_46_9]|nr:MAG: methylthioadenosine phosphorylase [Chloroflexi bacterium RBG_13_46_9]